MEVFVQNKDKSVPNDADAEKWVLGSILLRHSVLDEIGWLSHDDFFNDDYATIYRAMCDMHRRGEPIDPGLLKCHFKTDAWAACIAEIAGSVPVVAHVPQYAAIVAKLAKRRRILQALESGSSLAVGDEADNDAIIDAVESRLAAVKIAGERGEPVKLGDAAVDAACRIDTILTNGKGLGVPIGLYNLDNDIGGLFPGELCILAARPGVGKTSLALQIAYHNAMHGRLVYFASLEMSATELSTRIACSEASVSNHHIRAGKLSDADVKALNREFQEQSRANLEIHDSSFITAATIRREIRKRKKRGLTLAVIDYLQLVTPDDRKLAREQQVSRIVRDLKETAREYQMPILCLCQLNRQAAGDDIPRLSHLRESGAIEQDADVVMFLSGYEATEKEKQDPNSDYDPRRNATLWVAKNRNGETGAHRLHWDAARTRFEDISKPTRSTVNHYPEFDAYA